MRFTLGMEDMGLGILLTGALFVQSVLGVPIVTSSTKMSFSLQESQFTLFSLDMIVNFFCHRAAFIYFFRFFVNH